MPGLFLFALVRLRFRSDFLDGEFSTVVAALGAYCVVDVHSTAV